MHDRSRRFGLPFDVDVLTVEFLRQWLIRSPICECCGKGLDLSAKAIGKFSPASPSIDRVIPKEGYTLQNVALLCWRCNALKNNATADELQTIVDWMRSKEAPVVTES
jgi:hypothetical protein